MKKLKIKAGKLADSTLKLELSGDVSIQAKKDGESKSLPTFDMIAYTGAIISQGWGRTIVDLQGVSYKDKMAILANHNPETPVGHSEEIVIANNIRIKGIISGDESDPEVSKILTMGKNGFPWQASIGASIDEVEYLEVGTTAIVNGLEVSDDVAIVRASTLYETSILSLGADGATDTQISAKKDNFIGHFKETKEMKFKQWLEANGFNTEDKAILASLELVYKKEISAKKDADKEVKAVEASKEDATAKVQAELSEFKRVSAIKDACGDNAEFAKTAIDADFTVAQVEASISQLGAVKSERQAPVSAIKASIGSSKVVEAGLCLALGMKEDVAFAGISDEEKEQASASALFSFTDVARNLLASKGTLRLTDSKEDMLRLAMSTTSLPEILSNVGSKSLLESYDAVPSNVESVAKRKLFADFKEIKMLRVDKSLVLEEVGLNGEIKHGEVSESAYASSIKQYAKQLVIGRMMLINDDLGAFDDVFSGYGAGSSTAVQRNFWKVFVDNGGSFYSSGNGNLLSATPLSIDGVTEALKKLCAQTDVNGDPINVFGVSGQVNLIVPPSLATYAKQLAKETMVNETTTTNKAKPANNPHAGMINVIVDPYLNNANVAGGSSTSWFLQASGVDTFVDGRLISQQNPVMRSEVLPVGQLGLATDGVFDFGASQLDPKGIVKVVAV